MGARNRRRLAAAFPLVIVLLLVAFHYYRFLRAELEPPGPSFGRPMDLALSDLSGSVATLPGPGGDLLVLWSVRGGVEYFRVSPGGEMRVRGTLPLEVATPTGSPTSLLASPSALFWLGGPALTELWWAPLAPAGPSLGSPALLLTDVRTVRLVPPPPAADAAHEGAGVLPAAGNAGWGGTPPALVATRSGGLWCIPLGGDGYPQAPVRLAQVDAVLADAVSLADGRVVVVAAVTEQHGFRLEYLEFNPTHPRAGPISSITMGSYPLAEHELVRALRCGQDGEQVYVFLTRERRERGQLEVTSSFTWWSARQGPRAETEFAPLPLAEVGGRSLIWLASPDPSFWGWDPVTGYLPVAFSALNRGPRGRDQDILVAYFQGGRLLSAEFAALTQGAAAEPRLTALAGPGSAQRGHFLTWLDTAGTGRFRLRLTASLPAYREAMAKVRPGDMVAALGETGMGLLLSYLPFLFALAWTLPALVVLVIAHGVALNWSEQHPLTLGLVGLATYLGVKGWALRQVLRSPILALRGPPWLGPGLGLPLLVGSAGLATLLLLVGRQRATGLSWVGRFVLWDMLFTCLFLGPFFR